MNFGVVSKLPSNPYKIRLNCHFLPSFSLYSPISHSLPVYKLPISSPLPATMIPRIIPTLFRLRFTPFAFGNPLINLSVFARKQGLTNTLVGFIPIK